MKRKVRLSITINSKIDELIKELQIELDSTSKAKTAEYLMIEGLKALNKIPADKKII